MSDMPTIPQFEAAVAERFGDYKHKFQQPDYDQVLTAILAIREGDLDWRQDRRRRRFHTYNFKHILERAGGRYVGETSAMIACDLLGITVSNFKMHPPGERADWTVPQGYVDRRDVEGVRETVDALI